ncbi:MAG: hypothetical protein QM777_24565 [Pseudorhodoferax sp.]
MRPPQGRRCASEIRHALAPAPATNIADLHVWQVGPGHFAAIVSIASAAPREAPAYKALLAPIALLSHVTVETQRLPAR